jgi:2-aminoethylphosphonate-pyruvate transaminase
MNPNSNVPAGKDKVLFTPGPLMTSRTVKQAMLRDIGSKDYEFIAIVQDIRKKLIDIGQADPREYTTILLQGAGTYSLEAILSSTVPPDGKILVIINGAYGKRMEKIASVLKIETIALEYSENVTAKPQDVESTLKEHPEITSVAIVHCETTTGIINPIKEIGQIVAKAGAKYCVDAMSSFGAVSVNLSQCCIDYLVSSANKCIEGVPGFSFVLAKISSLEQTEGYARSVCFDLLDQYRGLEKNGQFRFTPPTHALIAYHQALLELQAEGGVEARAVRYKKNYETLVAGMREMGFTEYLKPEDQGYIITSFRFPEDKNFSFERFYELLNQRNFVIYPGKVIDAHCFRIGNIGRIFEADIQALLAAIREVIAKMGVRLK